MRLVILLLLAFAVTALFSLFPVIAGQPLRIEAFGWVFETQQGAFITALLVLLAVLWLLRRILSAIFAGPGQLWNTLRMGSRKRREQRLKEGIAEWIDMRGDQGSRAFRKTGGIIPEWAAALLRTATSPPDDLPVADSDSDPLSTALAARIATDPNAAVKPDNATQRAHLEAWLAAHPNAPLAVSRLAALAEDEGDWATAAELLEASWKQGQRSASSIKPRLAQIYIHLAEQQPDARQSHLRKAHRLAPENHNVILALGRAHIANRDSDAARKLWLNYLEEHNDFQIAAELLALMSRQALQAFQKLDRKDAARVYNDAMRWLQASLAHQAGLNGMANEIMDQLVERARSCEPLHSRAEWHAAAGEWEQAADCYKQLLRIRSEEKGNSGA
ncbi:MAG: heme biosynthesis HemY N-terminal domain-containing protein [Mariprofundaceae bacterium]|nr:heme biosynthesis HemY N-terminal domain-containing protein [Mariprofundaceae bacterium]